MALSFGFDCSFRITIGETFRVKQPNSLIGLISAAISPLERSNCAYPSELRLLGLYRRATALCFIYKPLKTGELWLDLLRLKISPNGPIRAVWVQTVPGNFISKTRAKARMPRP
jgi:hypothetical protein